MTSIARRSSSTSATSAKSRVTLVEIGPNLAETKDSTFEATDEDLPDLPPKSNFFNHLLEMFCLKWLKISKGKSQMQIDNNSSVWPSPWILPVYVVSDRQDKDLHPIARIAKCTIDTGNMQGNIVSRDFVENVLEYPSTRFLPLTDEEAKGGISITGDLHVPQGAIHLNWYHKSSTRVFRNMRFLISPAPNCDMIIGAQSIQKDRILTVPCLMAPPHQALPDIGVTRAGGPQDPEKAKLELIYKLLNTELNKKIKGKDPNEKDKVDKMKKELQLVTWALELHEFAAHKRKGIAYTAPEGDLSEEQLWENIESNYHEISHGLLEPLNPILVDLRTDLGHGDAKDPWQKPTPNWWDDVNYGPLNKKPS